MISLRNRGALPTTTQDEFENFAARIKAFFLREHNEDGTHVVPTAATNFVPIGAQLAWPTNTSPSGWLLCRGQAVSRVSYKKLFEVLSTTYGAGDGILTFNVPNLQGRAPYGKASSGTGSTLGGSFGSMDHTHTGPSHTHSIAITSDDENQTHDHNITSTSGGPSGTTEVQLGVGVTVASATHHHTTTLADTFDENTFHDHDVTGTTGASGTGATSTANPPGLAENWIIYTGVA